MAIAACHGVDVVLAAAAAEGGIHGLDIEAAMRVGRMAGGTGCLGGVGVCRVTNQTTQALVYAARCAVIPGAKLAERIGCVALGA